MSQRSSSDISLKLYFPAGGLVFTLSDLVDYNSNTVLSDSDAVFCSRCKTKTTHTLSREYNPDLVLVELVRATLSSGNTWIKNLAKVNFPVTDLKLPGFPRAYRVVSTCHHRGLRIVVIGLPRLLRALVGLNWMILLHGIYLLNHLVSVITLL